MVSSTQNSLMHHHVLDCYVYVLTPPHSLSRDVDDIHDMMDDITEQNEIADEISNVLAQPIGFAGEIDDVSLFVSLEFVSLEYKIH